jgi:arsenite methyltransferase
METREQLSPNLIYELVAEVGFKKYFHLGGIEATRELLDLCNLGKDSYVLDVGCASGRTACYIARRYGCPVVGVDILKKMIDRADERAQQEGVEDKVEFRIADAQDLPFEDNIFAVVISEFVTGLLAEKQAGVNEYLRVARSGARIGLNEATWVKTPPPARLVKYLSHTFGIPGEILTPDGWTELLETSGLREMVVRTHQADALSNTWEDRKDVLRVWPKVLSLYVQSRAFRRFIRETLSVPSNLLEYFGYGIYVGRAP